ncbi:MAG TPA: uroporphyrinogen decarboxylase family protein [Fimbriimonas sp.]
MTSRERLLTALQLGKPDRMPASLHQWQEFHLKTYMNGMSDLEAFAEVGLDAQIQHVDEGGQHYLALDAFERCSTPEWRDYAAVEDPDPEHRVIRHTIETPDGDLTYATESNLKTTWVTEHLIKSDREIDLIEKYMPVTVHDSAPVEALRDRIGDAGILRGAVWGDQAGCWQHACVLMDINDLIYRCIDEPEWVHRLLAILLEKKLRHIDSMGGTAYDIVETGGGASSSTVISPALHEEFCLPYDRKMHDALHAAGLKATYHTCGGTFGLEELIVANGCDASETFAPKSIGGNQEPWELAEKLRGRIAMIGGIDQFNVVTDGPPERIREKTFELFEKVGGDGGYICSLSDHFFDTPVQHLKAFAEAAKECRY